MTDPPPIPAFALFGEHGPFPDIIHVETFSARAPLHDWHIASHRHGQMVQLFAIKQGAVSARVEGAQRQFSDNAFLFVPAHRVHEFTFEPGTEGYVLSIPLSIIASIGPDGQQVQSALGQVISGVLDAPLWGLLEAVRTAYGARGPFRAAQLTALCHAILASIADAGSAAQPSPVAQQERLRDLDALVTEHAAEGWSASDYARAMSLSTGHLSRLARAATGMGAAAYIEHKLMEEACRLLAFTRLPVSSIGYRLGFSDPSYFSKRFSKLCGDTPSVYRGRFAQS